MKAKKITPTKHMAEGFAGEPAWHRKAWRLEEERAHISKFGDGSSHLQKTDVGSILVAP